MPSPLNNAGRFLWEVAKRTGPSGGLRLQTMLTGAAVPVGTMALADKVGAPPEYSYNLIRQSLGLPYDDKKMDMTRVLQQPFAEKLPWYAGAGAAGALLSRLGPVRPKVPFWSGNGLQLGRMTTGAGLGAGLNLLTNELTDVFIPRREDLGYQLVPAAAVGALLSRRGVLRRLMMHPVTGRPRPWRIGSLNLAAITAPLLLASFTRPMTDLMLEGQIESVKARKPFDEYFLTHVGKILKNEHVDPLVAATKKKVWDQVEPFKREVVGELKGVVNNATARTVSEIMTPALFAGAGGLLGSQAYALFANDRPLKQSPVEQLEWDAERKRRSQIAAGVGALLGVGAAIHPFWKEPARKAVSGILEKLQQ